MSVQSIVVSDISGEVLSPDRAARVLVSGHPSTDGAVELDVSLEEAARIPIAEPQFLSVTVFLPGSSPREVLLDPDALCGAFDVDVVSVLQNGRKVMPGRTEPAARVARRRRSPGSPDYSDPAFAGNVHRGRVTAAEAETVRTHLAEINERLRREGRPTIDPNDPIAIKRYRFPDPAESPTETAR